MWQANRPETTDDSTDTDHVVTVPEADADHMHTVPAERVAERREAVGTAPALGSMVARVILVLAGAGLMVAGALLDWVKGIAGTSLSWRSYYMTQMSGGSRFITSAGAIVIGIAIIGLIGFAARSGWPTRLAGALGVVAFVLFLIQAIRANTVNTVSDLQVGLWLVLGGGVVMVIGGFFGGWHTIRTARVRDRDVPVSR